MLSARPMPLRRHFSEHFFIKLTPFYPPRCRRSRSLTPDPKRHQTSFSESVKRLSFAASSTIGLRKDNMMNNRPVVTVESTHSAATRLFSTPGADAVDQVEPQSRKTPTGGGGWSGGVFMRLVFLSFLCMDKPYSRTDISILYVSDTVTDK